MWRYAQSSGNLTSQAGTRVAAGYSGYGTGRNNPLMQSVPNVGPVPVGFYNLVAYDPNATDGPGDSPDHGPYVIRLGPFQDNRMFGRSGFLIHGDKKLYPPGWASHGCIIMPRPVRELIWNSGDRQLEVVAS